MRDDTTGANYVRFGLIPASIGATIGALIAFNADEPYDAFGTPTTLGLQGFCILILCTHALFLLLGWVGDARAYVLTRCLEVEATLNKYRRVYRKCGELQHFLGYIAHCTDDRRWCVVHRVDWAEDSAQSCYGPVVFDRLRTKNRALRVLLEVDAIVRDEEAHESPAEVLDLKSYRKNRP